MKSSSIPQLVLSLFLILTARCFASDPQASYDATFGQAEKAALATPGTKDDAELAVKLLAGADSIKDDIAYATLLREKAFELGLRDPAGLPTAVTAADALLKEDPKGHSSYQERLLEGCKSLYAKAARGDKPKVGSIYLDRLIADADSLFASTKPTDAEPVYRQALTLATSLHSSRVSDIRSRLKEFDAREASQSRVNRLADRLKKDNQNKSLAHDLVIACIVELDDPNQAAPYALLTGDHDLEELIELVRKAKESGPTVLSLSESLRLADWYKGAADQAPAGFKVAVLNRSMRLYQLVSDDSSTSEADRLRIGLAMEDIDKSIRKLRPDAPGLDLLALINPKRDLITFTIQDRQLEKKEGWGTVQFPYTPPEEYDYEVVFTRVSGIGPVHQLCYEPRSSTSFRWIWGDPVSSGLEFTQANKVSSADLGALKNAALVNGRKYRALLKVRENGVQAFLDGKHIVDFATDYRDLKPSKLIPQPDHLGIGTISPLVIETAEVREVSGKGKVLK